MVIQRIAELEQDIQELRSNQAQKLSFAGITLDGTGEAGTLTSGAGTIIDATGLVSATNFQRSQLFNGIADLSTNSTSYVTVPGSALTSLTFDREVHVMVYLMSYGYNDSAITSNLDDYSELILYDSFLNGSVVNTLFYGATATNVTVSDSITNYNQITGDIDAYELGVVVMEPGTHNLELQYRSVNGGTTHLDAWLGGYMVLGT